MFLGGCTGLVAGISGSQPSRLVRCSAPARSANPETPDIDSDRLNYYRVTHNLKVRWWVQDIAAVVTHRLLCQWVVSREQFLGNYWCRTIRFTPFDRDYGPYPRNCRATVYSPP